ncbi:MAG: hypothetical protein DMF96_19935 [Acidobacteria bacterium]|nr:MAG: hypothetical protein DMF96_19935 [Acidobacteriota bacterium]
MGPGRDQSGKWHPYEDFRWSPEFAAFLAAVDRQSASAVDLILNGDTFELLQSTDGNCAGAAAGLGCTEVEALARLERVLRAHEADVKALGQFARRGSNRVVFVPGDHDAALLFPGVSRQVEQALAAPAGRVEVTASGYWSSADDQVYAEHGHQIGLSAHRFESWPSPFVRRGGREQLARPWGEAVIQELYNRYEPRYPVIDNVVASGIGVKYALAADPADIGDLAAPLVRYLLFTMSWQQFRMELDDGEVQPPTWDVAQVRAQGPSFLVSSLPDDDRLKPLAAKALADGRLAKSMEELAESRGAVFDYFWRSRDVAFARHLETVATRLSGRARPSVFVHGHTQLPDRSQTAANMISGGLLKIPMEGFSPVRGALAPIVINDGAWQRTITPVQLDRLASDRGVPEKELLASLQPEDLAPCYSFVQIESTGGAPVPAVRYWRQSTTGDWAIAAACGR